MAGVTHNHRGSPGIPEPRGPSSPRTLPASFWQKRSARLEPSAVALAAMWLFIAAVAAVDVYCSIKFEGSLLIDEMNPVGRWLLMLDGGSVSLFMACKFFCNLLALAALQVLYALHRPLCLAAAGVMSAVQGCLAIALCI